MAENIEYILDVASQTSKLDWAMPFQRTGQFPIDRSALFSSLADAQNYAKGDGSDERELGGTSYVGQIISVYEAPAGEGAGTVSAYIITPARGLMKLAATTASGDMATDIANLQGEVNTLTGQVTTLQTDLDEAEKAIALKATQADLEAEAQRATAAEEALAADIALKADKSYVDDELAKKAVKTDVDAALALKANDADVYKKSETYTQAEVQAYVQGQIGSAGHLKREIVSALPDIAEAELDVIYMIKQTALLADNDEYDEYMVIVSGEDETRSWEKIGNTRIDLTNYQTIEQAELDHQEISDAIALKADQSDLELANAEIAKKANSADVDSALAEKADKDQVATDIATAIAPLAKQADLESGLAGKVDNADFEALEQALELKADKSTVESELANKADKATTLAGYGIENAYTKEEVDAALLLKASQQDHNTLVDEVAKKADKADTLAGYGIADAYTKGETETKIAEMISDINGGESAGEVLAALNAYKTSNDEVVQGVKDRVQALEEVGAQANVIESITVDGEALPIENKAVALPAATAAKRGLVKSSAAENQVAVESDGTMTVNSVNVSKLVQTEGEYLILNGGAAIV